MPEHILKPLSDIFSRWMCPECGEIINHSFMDMIQVGNPVCPSCDCDMGLLDNMARVFNVTV